jgi:hypothetical protein
MAQASRRSRSAASIRGLSLRILTEPASRCLLCAAMKASASRAGNLTKPNFKDQAGRFMRWRKKKDGRNDASGSNLTFESRMTFLSDLRNVVVGLQAAISRFAAKANDASKPFAKLADPNKNIGAVR